MSSTRGDYRLPAIQSRVTQQLRAAGLLATDGHVDYGNGCHGAAWLDVAGLLECPSTVWRLADDLLDAVPADLRAAVDIVASGGSAGAILGHSLAGLLDGRRPLQAAPCRFVAFEQRDGLWRVGERESAALAGGRLLLVDHWRPPSVMLEPCLALARGVGAQVVACATIAAWPGAAPALDVPTITLCDRMRRDAVPAAECADCRAGSRVTRVYDPPPREAPGRAGRAVLVPSR